MRPLSDLATALFALAAAVFWFRASRKLPQWGVVLDRRPLTRTGRPSNTRRGSIRSPRA